ncbi:MAG: hypothetical protein K2Y05_04535, partial [Hyphomicrobiaceae bacterium]|nr:hypothetical protein [Hyphomicrobiaceae bacterium]
MTMRLFAVSILASTAFALTSCAAMDGNRAAIDSVLTPVAVAALKDASGNDRGIVEVFREGSGLRLEISVREFQPG